jgi:hypothetical protein
MFKGEDDDLLMIPPIARNSITLEKIQYSFVDFVIKEKTISYILNVLNSY